jgi:uncharacterized protein (DUF736 family)
MSNFDNNMRGVLFKNSEKRSEKSPDYLGKIEIENVEYQLAAWINTSSKTGAKYMSLVVSLPKSDTARPKQNPSVEAFDEDGMPF